jgi:hypothetical protein
MSFEVNPLRFASSDVKCFVFDRVIPETSADEKNLGSEKIRIPYHKPTLVGGSRRPRWSRKLALRNSAKQQV